MTSQRSVVFAEPVRTAIGTFGGSLKDVDGNLTNMCVRTYYWHVEQMRNRCVLGV